MMWAGRRGRGRPGTPMGFASFGFTAMVMTKSPLLRHRLLVASGRGGGQRRLRSRFARAEVKGADVVALPQLAGVAFEHRYSVLENDGAVGILQGDGGVLLGQQDRKPILAIEPLERFENALNG